MWILLLTVCKAGLSVYNGGVQMDPKYTLKYINNKIMASVCLGVVEICLQEDIQ